MRALRHFIALVPRVFHDGLGLIDKKNYLFVFEKKFKKIFFILILIFFYVFKLF
jgi:hypothetical protein